MKVVDKCLERLAGPYYIIPEFKAFMEEVKGLGPTLTPSTIIVNEEMQSDLFTHFTIFQFYIKSVAKPPGKGTGELLAASEKDEYTELARIPDWRRKLDTLWIAPFILDGHTWQSVEHYYQGAKYKRNNPDVYLQFSLDSDSAMAKDPAMAKVPAHNKKISIDDDFGKRGEKELEAAQYAKFSQNEELKRLLKATKNAKLQHFLRGSPPKVDYELMRVREKLQPKQVL
jgi:predicted NAD-dependent protein-ADP-ribosyltransferase YbiA (DUF1768 family)